MQHRSNRIDRSVAPGHRGLAKSGSGRFERKVNELVSLVNSEAEIRVDHGHPVHFVTAIAAEQSGPVALPAMLVALFGNLLAL
jgi:hypothetical protein